jgi:hypothetical protein
MFSHRADRFLEKTAQYVQLGVNPGDYYTSIWTRDAAYILRDQFVAGDTHNVLQCLYFIWSYQIDLNSQKIVYGRGSPELNFRIQHADAMIKEKFSGALPTTINQHDGVSEVYARNPDIDSTALMISTTSWILDTYLKAGLYSCYEDLKSGPKPLSSADYKKQLYNLSKDVRQSLSSRLNQLRIAPSRAILEPAELIEFIIPRMDAAIHYLASRDIDNDGLLEQGYNEDWMDTALRAGKIVYDQASWILAASDFSSLLCEIGEYNMASKLTSMAERTVNAVEEKLWSEEDGAYIDIKYDGVEGKNNEERMLTQDVSLYLMAITENSLNDNLSKRFKAINNSNDANCRRQIIRHSFDKKGSRLVTHKAIEERAARTLETIKNRIWKEGTRPLITEKELKRTGPWVLDSNQYHNHTFWPWMTGIEMLARSRFQRYGECNDLLSELTRENYSQTLAYYEWINPVTGKGSGAFPFRTGISTIRMALSDTLLSHYS